MYEHPYLAYTVSAHDQEQIRRAADRRRFVAEHADQIVARQAGPIRRLARRMLRAVAGARRIAADGAPDAVAPADRRVTGACEPAAAR